MGKCNKLNNPERRENFWYRFLPRRGRLGIPIDGTLSLTSPEQVGIQCSIIGGAGADLDTKDRCFLSRILRFELRECVVSVCIILMEFGLGG